MEKFQFGKGLVKSGTKNVSEAYPALTLTSTYSAFKLNNKAMAALDMSEGERVIMFDMLGKGVETQEERYFIAKSFNDTEGGLIGANRSFRYSGIYNTMLANDIEFISLSSQDLIDKDLIVKSVSVSPKTNKETVMFVSKKTISFELIPINNSEPVDLGNGESVILYQLANAKFKDHTPKKMNNNESTIYDNPELSE